MILISGSCSHLTKPLRQQIICQGDPLSPYLFVIAMNSLSLMLNKAAEEKKFNYHHKCSASKLTHLCFADDLLIFTDGSLHSVQQVLQVLREFELRSGLAVSVQKSSFYASGLTNQEIATLQASTGMPSGCLPVRYLGVPLCTKKLSLSNCQILLQQVKSRLISWSAKSLSFAGRLLLIKTVVAGISTFWCSSFILPKECIRRIDSLCGVFLWQGDIEKHHTARVAWVEVTKPKKEGGLGIKDLRVWNRACCLKLIWLLFFQSGSVWVAWFKQEILQGCINNFWTTKTKQKNTWLANKILRLRDEIFSWIKLRPGNGISCRFWSDNYSPFGCIRSFFSGTPNSSMGIRANATLSSLFHDGHWTLPPARSEIQVQLQSYLTTLQLTQEEDYYEWEIDGAVSLSYSIGQVYDKLRQAIAEVSWHRLVWNKGGIPRHSFLTWLFVLNRCPTRDRIQGWGLNTDSACLLCNSGDESRDHLLFECNYSWSLWSAIAARCSLLPTRSWDSSVTQLQQLPATNIKTELTLLAWQATIYWIWTERNCRLHRNKFRPWDTIKGIIEQQLKEKILSFRNSRPRASSNLMQLWLSTLPTHPLTLPLRN